MTFLYYIYLAVAIVYILFIFFCRVGWRRIPLRQFTSHNPSTSVSIIIPARNEEQNILSCLEDLAMQDYPTALHEIIIVDDDSTDDTAELINEFIEVNPDKTFRFIQIKENNLQTYKKLAITKGIEAARGQLIITTDADCRFSPKWISSIVQQYEDSGTAMISAPVCFHNEETIFEKMQSLEFMGLIGIGAGALRNHRYIMCNGANLAYSKNIFHQVDGFNADNNIASGDDTQLMLKIAAAGKQKIIFLKSREAIVYTSAKNSLIELIRQRKRWASKIPSHSSKLTVLIAASVFILHAGIIAAALWMLLSAHFSLLLFLPFAGKCIVEFIFLFDVSRFFKRQKLLLLFLPAQIIYPFYIIFIGTIAPFGTYLWKERKVK